MRSILVHANRDPGLTARLETALAIARRENGHVTLLFDTPIGRFVSGDHYGNTFVAREALEAALADDGELADDCVKRLSRDDVAFDVVQFETEPVEAMAASARLADLAIVSRGCGFAGDLAVAATCPVLVLDAGQELRLPLRTACIAWDGSEQAARALKAAVPLIRDCPDVHVLYVTDETSDELQGTDAMRYLSRHGIKAELHVLAKGGSIKQTLVGDAAERNADLLVMGAFSHSRAREFLFGGVTRFALETQGAPPLLLGH